jgi:hypothetical protein
MQLQDPAGGGPVTVQLNPQQRHVLMLPSSNLPT